MESKTMHLKRANSRAEAWTKNICVVAAEASGDVNAALLIEALKESLDQSLHIWGIAGPKMRKAGVQAVAQVEELSVMGFAEVLSEYVRIRQIHRLIEAELIKRLPALLILVDAPSFNLRLAEFAYSLGIVVHYHIPPKVWVHGLRRVETLRNFCYLVTCVLPFEEKFLRKHQVPALYVGHPLKDSASLFWRNHSSFLSGATVRSSTLCVGLLPGSRKSEIRAHLSTLVRAFEKLRKHFEKLPGDESRKVVALIPVAETLDEEWFQIKFAEAMHGLELPVESIRIVNGSMYSVLSQVQYAWVCSGTATLETCFFEVPHAVFYKTNWFTYQIAKCIVGVPFASLVNLVAGRELTPEFLQDRFTVENLVAHAIGMLSRPSSLKTARSELHEVSEVFESGSAQRVAAAVIKLMDYWSSVPVPERMKNHRNFGSPNLLATGGL